MADTDDIWALKEQLEDAPDDHELRWVVAKQFYAACEYRHALEELQILRNEWQPRVNVVRFLAASYFRLGRYEESIRELRRAIETWPDELALREQLAKVLEVADQKQEAVKVWEALHQDDPKHPLAGRAAKRLRKQIEKEYQGASYDMGADHVDSGINLKPGQTCPKCGAQNALDTEVCWQCQAPIFSVRTPRPSRRPQPLGFPTPSNQRTLRLAAGLVTGLLLAACVYLGLRDLAMMDNAPATTLADLYTNALAPTRAIVGVTLLAVWPLAIFLALYAVDAPDVPGGHMTVAGLFLAALTVWSSFLGLQGLLYGAAVTLVLGFPILWVIFGLKPGKAAAAWGMQALLVVLCALAALVLTEYARTGILLNPMRDVPAITRFTNITNTSPAYMQSRTIEESVPIRQRIEWAKSASPWINHYAQEVYITIEPIDAGAGLEVELADASGSTQGYLVGVTQKTETDVAIIPGQPYTLKIAGPAEAGVTLTIRGIAPHQFLP